MLALVTCGAARSLDTDLPLLAGELPEAEIVVWDDATVEWGGFDAVVVRSTWDYHERRDDFLAWATHVEARTTFWNPTELIVWNTDKRYLLDLDRAGIPTIPSVFVGPGDAVDLSGTRDRTADLVIKPSVGAGSNGVVRTRGSVEILEHHVEELHARGHTAMIQPYLGAVDELGETALVYLGGDFSHAVGKAPILAGEVTWEGGLFATERVESRTVSAEQRAVGDRVMEFLPPTAYARIDLLPGHAGSIVLEVEVTEPSLFLECDPDAPARAAAVFRNLTP